MAPRGIWKSSGEETKWTKRAEYQKLVRRLVKSKSPHLSLGVSDVFGPCLPKSLGLEGHSSWREGTADKEAKRGSTNEEGAWWTGLILPQLWVRQETGVNAHVCPPS